MAFSDRDKGTQMDQLEMGAYCGRVSMVALQMKPAGAISLSGGQL